MESYCVFLMGQFVATRQFARDFGVYSDAEGDYIIEASWQSAFQCSGPVGAFIGVFIAGPITSKIGYRWATIGGLMALNAFIFIFYLCVFLSFTTSYKKSENYELQKTQSYHFQNTLFQLYLTSFFK